MDKVLIKSKVQNPFLSIGLVQANGLMVSESPSEFKNIIETSVVQNATMQREGMDEKHKTGIRKLLKEFGFKPSGRNKPASEYLLQYVSKNKAFYYINNVVDANNYTSLHSHLPISIVDLDKTSGVLEIKIGLEGETYVFNTSGQEIDLKNLICTCNVVGKDSIPIANPIKDSMETKIDDNTTNVLGIIYSNNDIVPNEVLSEHLTLFERCLKDYAGANETKSWII